ncbi:hypothetical protein C0993_009757 [Termitomyces sp. T159_Od127]|nr:hypothetical protein C0993_009757 [Termitomyces sp. T159_Od127]
MKPSNEFPTPSPHVPLNTPARLLSPAPSTFSQEVQTRSPSLDPISLFDVSPLQSTAFEDLAQQGTPVHKDLRLGDNLSHQDTSSRTVPATCSPDIRVPSSRSTSPSTPTATQNPPQDSLLHDSPILLPDRAPAPINGEPDDTLLNDTDISNLSRYPLRKRAPAQLKPYTVEKYQYKQALSANPDAIVNIRNVGERMGRDHYDHTDDHLDETQALWQPPEETQGDSDDERWHSRTKVGPREVDSNISEERPVQYSELLQDLSSSDDEELKSMQRFSKEAKRLERQRRKAKLEEERQARSIREGNDRGKARVRPKAFPVEKPSVSTSRSPSSSIHPLPPPSPSITYSRPRSQTVPPSPVQDVSHQASSPTSPSSFRSSLPPYIDNDEADNSDARPGGQSSVDLSDPESQSGRDSEVDGEDAPPRQVKMSKGVKTLLRMYPYSMIKELAAANSSEVSTSKSKARRNTEDLSESEDEETAVLPRRSRSGWSTRSRNKRIEDETRS